MQKPPQYSTDKTTLDGKTKQVKITKGDRNLKACPVFDNLVLSAKGSEYLDDINSRLKLGSWLTRIFRYRRSSYCLYRRNNFKCRSCSKINRLDNACRRYERRECDNSTKS